MVKKKLQTGRLPIRVRYQNLLCNFCIKDFSRLILPVKIKLRLHKGYIKSETVFYIDKIDKN